MSYQKVIEQSKSLRKQADTLQKAPTNQSEKPLVVVWGLMNAGKSYLLNMLTKHIDQEYFKVNDFRETAVNSVFDDEKCCYVDTPGLDANAKDNAEALKGVAKADVVLFVHQLQGELEAVEIEFLKKIKDSYGEYASDNIIIILSKIDKESPEKVLEIQTKVLEQCKKTLGFEPKCFQISNTRYKKGVETHKDALIRNSHVDELKQHIEQNIGNATKVRRQKANFEKKQLLEKLLAQKQTLEQEKYQKRAILEDATKQLKAFTNDMQSLIKFIDNKISDYQNI